MLVTDLWPAYETAVPHGRVHPVAAERLAWARMRRGPAESRLEDVADVVVVASSSRGGSTMLGELLRGVPGTVHLSAESNPMFTVAHGATDRRGVLVEELRADLGRAATVVDVDVFSLDVLWRLTLQWPAVPFDPDRVHEWVVDALGGEPYERVRFGVRLLAHVRAAHPVVDPWYYDLPGAAVREAFPGVAPPSGPPGPDLLEMPPFVVPAPWEHVPAGAGPVILTTPRNSYRLEFLRDLFPSAHFRVLHLVRNPAATVNGLIDGWDHRGFFNCDVGRPLAIAGYSRRASWSRRWWKFDLPPGWESLTSAPLPAVGAAQWASAHDATLEFVEASGVESLRVRYEDLVGSASERADALCRIAGWLDADADALVSAQPRPVMATVPPRPRRWRGRTRLLAPVLEDAALLGLAERLGYPPDPASWG